MLQSAHAFAKVFVIDQNREIVQGTLDMEEKTPIYFSTGKLRKKCFGTIRRFFFQLLKLRNSWKKLVKQIGENI